MRTALLDEPVSTSETLSLLEKILDSPYESDKWRQEVERHYIRMGGGNKQLVNPALREFIQVEPQPSKEVRDLLDVLQDISDHAVRTGRHADFHRQRIREIAVGEILKYPEPVRE